MGDVKGKGNLQRQIMYHFVRLCFIYIGIVIAVYIAVVELRENGTSLQRLRIQYSDMVQAAEDGDYKELEKYDYYIVDMQGKIVKSDIKGYEQGTYINLHSLSTGVNVSSEDREFQYMSPIVQNNEQIGTLVIQLRQKKQIITRMEGIILFILFLSLIPMVVWGVYLSHYLRKNLSNPIKELCRMMDQFWENTDDKMQFKEENYEFYELAQKASLLQDEIDRIKRQAERADKNEKLLMACVSHDLRTPVSIIIGSAECIRDGRAVTKEKMNHYTNVIISRSEHLTKLFDSILEQASVEADKQNINRREIYAQDYIEHILAELCVEVETRGLVMQWNEIPNVILVIDPIKIQRVFQNIIENSVKYTPKGGKITIQFEHIEDLFSVEILDNGFGIAATDIPFIFDRFYRGEKARTQRSTSGSGLGLSIAKEILESHGTRIECDSVLGQGTCMRFLLPLG